MGSRIWAAAIVFSLPYAHALAQTCSLGPPDTRLSLGTLESLIQNKYACVGSFPNATWNELHRGGTIIDYKKGPSDPIDPTASVGSYTVTAGGSGKDGVITYRYGGSGTVSFYVQSAGGAQYYFCPTGGGSVIVAKVQADHC